MSNGFRIDHPFYRIACYVYLRDYGVDDIFNQIGLNFVLFGPVTHTSKPFTTIFCWMFIFSACIALALKLISVGSLSLEPVIMPVPMKMIWPFPFSPLVLLNLEQFLGSIRLAADEECFKFFSLN